MEIILVLLLVFIETLGNIHLIQAQSQRGFISLDCGLAMNESYSEPETGLRFISDANFTQGGETGRIQTNLLKLKPYRTLRYFPEGIRNCYNLPVEKGRKYLVRAVFVYGNYDNSGINPNFDLYLGPNLWATMDMEQPGNSDTIEELIYITTSNSLQICLVKTGDTTPLISSLELRPMASAYRTQSGPLKLLRRIYYSKANSYIRYPNDEYDHLWMPRFLPQWTPISTNISVSNLNEFNLPKAVLATAAIPTDANMPLSISWSSENPDDKYHMFFHINEIQDLQANETRKFTMFLNGEIFSDPLVPQKLRPSTISNFHPVMCGGKCCLQLIRASRSTLPPLLSAYEIYKVIPFIQSETNEMEVVAINSIKDTYHLTRINWQGDPCVPQHLMWDGLNCIDMIISTTSPKITSLNLSSIGLTGIIATSIQNLTHLEKLDLSNNNLTGEVPEFLGNIKSLLLVNLSKNDLNGSIPQALLRKGVKLILDGNPRLCLSCTKPHSKTFPVASVASMATLIAALVLFLVLRKKKSTIVEVTSVAQWTASMSPTMNVSQKPLIERKRKRFNYFEVMKMTNNFQRVLGKGGFGHVYHGTLNDFEQVAVKVLSQSSAQGFKQFKAEVELLLRVHHINLVDLVGYCDEEDHLALIYEFVLNGDLKEHLSRKQGRSIINWAMRLRIAVEAALGLEYLHIGCKPPMVHRDVKTTNILLGEHFKAKLADFGLSRSFPVGDESDVSTMIAGTLGYLDPEYYNSGWLSEKSDVYSFGIVLLEMITNQPVIDQSREKSYITEWVRFELNRGDINKIMDPNLHGDYESRSAWKALELAMSCSNPSSSRRPDMSQVVIELKGCLVSENSRRDLHMGSQNSVEVSVSSVTEMFPVAR